MSQRNFQNDRYKDEGYKGATRKSAGSAKPKTKAGSSVTAYSPKQKAAADKAKRKKMKAESDAESRARQAVANVALRDNPKYKFWRKMWYIFLGAAIVFVALSFVAQYTVKDGGALESLVAYQKPIIYVTMGLGYLTLIIAFVIEFVKCRKIRQDEESKIHFNKDDKKQIAKMAEERAAKSKGGLLGGLFGKK